MIDVKRRLPRFDVKFEFQTNEIEGKGVNISQKGFGFFTEEELIPAEDIPFSTEVKGYIFSNKVYTIKGNGRLLFSRSTKDHRELYYNGFEIINLDKGSQDNLIGLIRDINDLAKKKNNLENKTLADYLYFPSDDLFDKTSLFTEAFDLSNTKNFQMFSYYMNSPSSPVASFIHRKTKESKEMIMMGSNNYLGLTKHPDVIKAGVKALEKYGSGNGSGAMVGGTLSIHKELEEKLADFTGKEQVMIFNSGYSTNLGVISGLLRPNDAAINDQYNHASIFDGCTLSQSKTLYFTHNSVDSLKRVINRVKLKYNSLLIIVDGVYSTDGTTAPLKEITKIAKKNKCRLMVDEAHGFGVLGKKGIGACEYFDVVDDVDIIMGTMSKSLAGVGGFAASKREVIEYLRYYARSYLFSTNVPPSVAGCILKSLEILSTDNSIREKLLSNVEYFKTRLQEMDLNVGNPNGAIVPIIIPDISLLLRISGKLFEKGVFHNVMSYPAVPLGGSLLRFGIMANHSIDDLNKVCNIIEEIGLEEGLIGIRNTV